MNSSSDMTISSDWDVIDHEFPPPDSTTIKPEETITEELQEKLQRGSCVDDVIPEQEIVAVLEGVPDVAGLETSNQHESSSSSEFDVLDEAVEDNQSNLSFSHMEYSLSSSLESSPPILVVEDAEVEADLRDETPQPISSQRRGLNVHPYLVAITLSLAFIAILFATPPFNSFQQLKKRVSALQTENSELKNLVQSKMENDKILLALEEQIKSLKDENFQLSVSMKALITQLEEQTLILKKDKERKEQDPYRSEIEKLKEQINILQIDNEELQKQLVRTRYGIYSPHPKDPKANPSLEGKEDLKDKTDNVENRDNASDIVMEEINELRKKLYAEVEKLKNWKDSVQHIVKELGNGYAESSEKEQDSFKGKKSSENKERPNESKAGKKGKKFSDWSWGSVKKNIRDTYVGLQDIDVPNMIANYLDRKKIEGVFESVNHYFKKAQEKTKKVLNFNDDGSEEMWQFFGHLRNQWNDVKDKYFQKYFPAKPAHIKAENYKSQHHERKPMPPHNHDFQAEKKFNRYEKQSKDASNENNKQRLYPDLESFEAPPTAETPHSEKNYMASEDKETNADNSWMFKRAAHRSQLREEEQEAFTNWFLKRGQDFHYNEDESLKEWFRETYQNGNEDEE